MSFGRIKIEGEIGRGGMGIVWRAVSNGRRVVVKELRRELAEDPQYVAMFEEEARLAIKLRHPNIVETYEVGCDRGRWFMVLESLEGCTLTRALSLLGDALPLGARVRIVRDVLVALHHAHTLTDHGRALGVVHRDVTPNNVFVTFDGRVKLLDFGVAKCRGRANETRQGVIKGSVAYMSPDHVSGSTIDRRADVFSAGVMLREMITGERLWGDLEELAIVRSLVAGKIPAFPEHAVVSRELRAIAEKAMTSTRADRYASADEMREALDRWLATTPSRSLVEIGARLAGAAAGVNGQEVEELSTGALVTDASSAGASTRWKFFGSVAAAGIAMIVAATGTLALVRDALVDDAPVAAAAAITTEPPPLAVTTLPPPAPAPTPVVVAPEPEPVATDEAPELPPNPYDDADGDSSSR